MQALTSADLIPYEEYEKQREGFRANIIALKQRRRISIGPWMTLVFENRRTLQFQIQEMIRVERIFDSGEGSGRAERVQCHPSGTR